MISWKYSILWCFFYILQIEEQWSSQIEKNAKQWVEIMRDGVKDAGHVYTTPFDAIVAIV